MLTDVKETCAIYECNYEGTTSNDFERKMALVKSAARLENLVEARQNWAMQAARLPIKFVGSRANLNLISKF